MVMLSAAESKYLIPKAPCATSVFKNITYLPKSSATYSRHAAVQPSPPPLWPPYTFLPY